MESYREGEKEGTEVERAEKKEPETILDLTDARTESVQQSLKFVKVSEEP